MTWAKNCDVDSRYTADHGDKETRQNEVLAQDG